GIRDEGPVSLTLTNMFVQNNTATNDGAGISMENTVSTPWTLTLNNTTVSGNKAGDAGGGVDTDGHGTLIITGSSIRNNTSVNNLSTFTGNTAAGNTNQTGGGVGTITLGPPATTPIKPTGTGGAIWSAAATTTILGSTVTGNKAGALGGGLFIVTNPPSTAVG